MRTGYTISAIGHALVLAWGLVSFSAKPFEVEPVDSVSADIISERELSELTAGSKTAKQVTKPVPIVDKIGELFDVQLDAVSQHANATTIAGLLNGMVGHVPRTGESIEFDGLRFEVLEANQRKVLRVRARKSAGRSSSARTV